jgi:acyl carrier protein
MANELCPTEMKRDAIQARVMQVIATAQDVPVEFVTLEKTFAELNIDSFAGINVVFELENEFGITIPDEGAQTIRSVRDAVAGVLQLLNEKGSLPA